MFRAALVPDIHITDDLIAGPWGHAAILDKVKAEILAANVNAVLCAGDLTGQVSPHRSTPRERNTLIGFLLGLAAKVPVVVVRGNHDFPGDHAYLNDLRCECGIYYDESPQVIELPGAGIATLPWIDAGQLPKGETHGEGVRRVYGEALDAMAPDFRRIRERGDVGILVGHIAAEGASIGEGQPVSGTRDPVVPTELICRPDMFDVCLFGHLHDPQDVPARVPTTYGGSCFVSTYGEFPRKAWHLITVTNRDDVPKIDPRPIVQPARVTVLIDVGGRFNGIKPVEYAPRCGSVADLSAVLATSPARVKIKIQGQGDLAAAASRAAEVRAVLAPLAVSMADPEFDLERVERVRAGAVEVAKAPTVGEKAQVYFDHVKPGPSAKVKARALAIVGEALAEVQTTGGAA